MLVVDRATTAEHLYVGMTRGRHHNQACVITEAAGDEHTRREPPAAAQVLAGALRKTSNEKSATETLRDELDQHGHSTGRQAAILEALRQTPSPQPQPDHQQADPPARLHRRPDRPGARSHHRTRHRTLKPQTRFCTHNLYRQRQQTPRPEPSYCIGLGDDSD